MKVLYLAHRVPWPPDKGDRLRSHGILRHLVEQHRAEVFLGAFADDGDPAAAHDALRATCAEVKVLPRPGRLRGLRALWSGRPASCEIFSSPRMDAWARDVCERVRPDVALGFSGQTAELLLSLSGPRRLLDLCDVDSAKWAERWRTGRNPVYLAESRRLRALEMRCLRELEGMTVATRREADLLGGESDRLRVFPTGTDLAEYAARRRDPGGAKIGFVGAMDYPPNAEGALWFAREVLPIVRSRRPDAQFVVIGRKPPAALSALPGVVTTGWVEDIRPVLQDCAVGVVPILTSHGIQSKAVVALALGVPQIVTGAALGGLDAEPERDLLAADGAPDFAGAVLRLLDNPADRERLSAAGRAFAERRFDWRRVLAPLDDLLSPAAARREAAVSRRTVP